MALEESLSGLERDSARLWKATDADGLWKAWMGILRDRGAATRVQWLQTGPGKIRRMSREHAGLEQPDAATKARLVEAVARQPAGSLAPGNRPGRLRCMGVEWLWLVRREGGRLCMILWHGEGSDTDQAAIRFLTLQLRAVEEWIEKMETARRLIHLDDLTGLHNARYLDLCLETEIRRSQRFQTTFCLLFIDLDNFKSVNDTWGHLAGSSVLQQVGRLLRMDLREVDLVFRYGGDEFVVLLLETNTNTGLAAAERIRRRLESSRFRVGDSAQLNLTASIGVAAWPRHGLTKRELLRFADQGMYHGKKYGKNQVALLDDDRARQPEPELNLAQRSQNARR